MMLARPPAARLRPFVELLWVCFAEGPSASRERRSPNGFSQRERVLPTGNAHLVFRFDAPLRTYAGDGDFQGQDLGLAVLGGPRAEPYLRDVARPVTSVGALLTPGATALFAHDRADMLAHRHTPLNELWGSDAERTLDHLQEATTPEQRLARFEASLDARLPCVRGVHPAVAHALARFNALDATRAPSRVGHVADETGYSHRRFDTLFREAVGLTPKRYCRLRRFQSALEALASRSAPLVELALAAGYADQPHLTREFREFTGLTPSEYCRRQPRDRRHVPEPR